MTNAKRWERVPPPEPCNSPDGHTYVVDHMIYSRAYSVNVRCPRCRRPWQVVKLEEEAP